MEAIEEINSDTSERGFLAEIHKSIRIIDLIGQILRNRYGSLTKEQLVALSNAALGSGLKFLNFFLELTRKDQQHILDFLQNIFETHSNLTETEIAGRVRKTFLMLCYGTSFSVIRKIANSIGSNKLLPIFDIIAEQHSDSPARQLINIAIKLEFTKEIPKNDISKLNAKLENNPIAKRLLQEVVIQHLYLNIIDYKDRQWISSTLDLPIKKQRYMQRKLTS